MVKNHWTATFANHSSAWILFLLALSLRVLFIQFQGLSNDELSGWFRTQVVSWDDFWTKAVMVGDMHPYFYQALMHLWSLVFPPTDWGLRSLPLLIFCFNFYLIYKIALHYFSKTSGLLLLAIYAGSSFLIIHTSTTRPYSIGLFFLLILVYQILYGFQKDNRYTWKNKIILALAFYGCMVSLYFCFLTAGVFGLLALLFSSKENRKALIVSGMIALLLFAPHIPVTKFQLSAGGLGWLDAPKISWPLDFSANVFNNSYWILAFFLLITILSRFYREKYTKNQKFLMLSMTLLIVISTVLSYVLTPIVRELVFQFIFPFLFLALFGVMNFPFGKWGKIAPFLFFIGLAFSSIIETKLYQAVHYGEFEQLGIQERKWVEKKKESQYHFLANFNNPNYLSFYSKRSYSSDTMAWGDPLKPERLSKELSNSNESHLIYSWSNNYHHCILLEVMQQSFPNLVSSKSYFNSGQYYFSKIKGAPAKIDWFYKSKKKAISEDEFFGQKEIRVSALKSKIDGDGYFVFEAHFDSIVQPELFLVAVGNRNGEMLKDGENPIQYTAYDSKILKTGKKYLRNAFQLSEKLKGDDVINFYVWNPQRRKVTLVNGQIGFKKMTRIP